MTAVTLALLAAFVHAAQGVLSKGLTTRYPARPMIGVLLALNCLLVLPFAFFVEWHLSPTIVLLHVLSVVMLVGSSIPIWDMFDAGAASATLTAQALSPLAAVVGTALLIPGAVSPPQVLAAVLVVAGVTWALRDAFASLGRRGAIIRILIAATGVGMLTVLTRMLADVAVCEALLRQSERFPERGEVLDRYLERAEPRCRHLRREITHAGKRLLALLEAGTRPSGQDAG